MGILGMRAKTTVFDTGYRACVPDRGVGEKVSAMSSSRNSVKRGVVRTVLRFLTLQAIASTDRKKRCCLSYGVHVVAYFQVSRVDLANAQALQAVEPLKFGVDRLHARDDTHRDGGRQLSPKKLLMAVFS